MNAIEQFFLSVLLTKFKNMTIQMKATEQYFLVVLFYYA